MTGPAEMDEYVYQIRQLKEEIRMEIAAANEATARLRQARKDIKHLLDTEVPRIVAEAVAFHINRSKVESTRNR